MGRRIQDRYLAGAAFSMRCLGDDRMLCARNFVFAMKGVSP